MHAAAARTMLRALLARYEHASKVRPVVVQIATGSTVMALGDTLAQLAVERRKSLDVKRVAVSSLFTGFGGWLICCHSFVQSKISGLL